MTAKETLITPDEFVRLLHDLTALLGAARNALTLLESLGYVQGGDVHDDLADALRPFVWVRVK